MALPEGPTRCPDQTLCSGLWAGSWLSRGSPGDPACVEAQDRPGRRERRCIRGRRWGRGAGEQFSVRCGAWVPGWRAGRRAAGTGGGAGRALGTGSGVREGLGAWGGAGAGRGGGGGTQGGGTGCDLLTSLPAFPREMISPFQQSDVHRVCRGRETTGLRPDLRGALARGPGAPCGEHRFAQLPEVEKQSG